MARIEGKRPYDLAVHATAGPGADHIEVRLSETEKLQIDAHIRAEIETDDYRIQLTTGLDADNNHVIDKLYVERKRQDVPGITGDRFLASLGARDVLARIVERGTFRWIRDPSNPTVWTHDASTFEEVKEAPYYAFRTFKRPEETVIHAQAREVADMYLEARAAGNRAPRRYIAEQLHLSPRTVSRRIDYARSHGMFEEGTDDGN